MENNAIPEINISLEELQKQAKEQEAKPHYFLARNHPEDTFVCTIQGGKSQSLLSKKGNAYTKINPVVQIDGNIYLLDGEFQEVFFEKYGKLLDGRVATIKSIKNAKGFYDWVVL